MPAPVVVVLPLRLLNSTWPQRLHQSAAVAGAVACLDGATFAGTPMEQSLEFPDGTGAILSSIPFPISLATGANCADLWRRTGDSPSQEAERRRDLQRTSLIRAPAAKITTYMGPADMNAPTCLARGRCQPLGGQSVWSTLAPIRPNTEFVIVSAPLDAPTFFHANTPAVSAAAAPLAVLAAVAAAVAKASDASALPKTLVFAGFQGEAWHRAGSRAFFRDVSSFACAKPLAATESPTRAPLCARPLRLDTSFAALNVSAAASALVLRGVASPAGASRGVFLRATDGLTITGPAKAALDAAALSIGVPSATGSPSPRFSAARSLAAERGMPVDGAVVSAFPDAWPEPGFGTPADDDVAALNHTQLAQLATVVARAAHSLAGGADAARVSVAVTADEIAALVPCFTSEGTGCAALAAAAPWRSDAAAPLSYYSGVYATPRQPYAFRETAPATFWSSATYAYTPLGFSDGWKDGDLIAASYSGAEPALAALLAKAAATAMTATAGASCGKDKDCSAGLVCGPGTKRCVPHTVHYHNAVSPALAPTADFDWTVRAGGTADDEDDPLYTEPFWGPPSGPPLSAVLFLLDNTLEAGFVSVLAVAVATAITVALWTFRDGFLVKRKWL